jgi:hypothetical protein
MSHPTAGPARRVRQVRRSTSPHGWPTCRCRKPATDCPTASKLAAPTTEPLSSRLHGHAEDAPSPGDPTARQGPQPNTSASAIDRSMPRLGHVRRAPQRQTVGRPGPSTDPGRFRLEGSRRSAAPAHRRVCDADSSDRCLRPAASIST